MQMRFAGTRYVLTMLVLSTVGACNSGSRDRTSETAAAPAGASPSSADASGGMMSGRAGGMGAMQRDTMAAMVDAHLKRMQTTNPDSLHALVPQDRQVVTAFIADCEQMMRAMKMNPPAKWRNAVQDLRQDLDRMASMTGAELQQSAPEHRKRIEGMLAMRHDMMRM